MKFMVTWSVDQDTPITRYLGQWNPQLDLDVAPVLDDEESAKAARGILESQGG